MSDSVQGRERSLSDLANVANAMVQSRQDYRLYRAATADFVRFVQEENPGVGKSLRVLADLWLETNTRLERQTRQKYYNSLLQVLEQAAANGLLPVSETRRDRPLPAFSKPERRSDREKWIAYERFVKWYAKRNAVCDVSLSQSIFRCYASYLTKENGATARVNYNNFRAFWAEKLTERFSPAVTVPPFDGRSKLRYGLPYNKWPEGIRMQFEQYAARVTANRIESLDAECSPVSTGTLKQYRDRIGGLLGYIVHFTDAQVVSTATLVDVLADADLVGQYVDWHIANCSGGNEREFHVGFLRLCAKMLHVLDATNQRQVENASLALRVAASSIKPVEAHDFEQVERPAFMQLARAVERCLADIEAIYGAWCHAGRPPADAGRVAFEFGLGLLFAVISWRPMRSRNYREMSLGRNLVHRSAGWKLSFGGTETKTGLPIELDWPDLLVGPLEIYINELRPILDLRGLSNVFLQDNGEAFSRKQLWAKLTKVGLRYLNAPSTPHSFRRWVVSGYLLEHPGDIETCRCLLGHRYVTTTLKHYAFVLSRVASRRVCDFVRDSCPYFTEVGNWRPCVS